MKFENRILILAILFVLDSSVITSCTPSSVLTPTPTSSPTLTPAPTATPLHSPTPTPVINDAKFLLPVELNLVPLYNAFDLNPSSGEVEIQDSRYLERTNHYCNGAYFYPGTPDNHFGWDFGTGNCSKHLVGSPVHGMSVGFDGIVTKIDVSKPGFEYLVVDYGLIRCIDGEVRQISIQYSHSTPLVSVGDKVNSAIQIAELEMISVEVEILVTANGKFIDPSILGLEIP